MMIISDKIQIANPRAAVSNEPQSSTVGSATQGVDEVSDASSGTCSGGGWSDVNRKRASAPTRVAIRQVQVADGKSVCWIVCMDEIKWMWAEQDGEGGRDGSSSKSGKANRVSSLPLFFSRV